MSQLPLFFPRIAIALWPLFNKEQAPAEDDQTVD
jgi:hypothetical protein